MKSSQESDNLACFGDCGISSLCNWGSTIEALFLSLGLCEFSIGVNVRQIDYFGNNLISAGMI